MPTIMLRHRVADTLPGTTIRVRWLVGELTPVAESMRRLLEGAFWPHVRLQPQDETPMVDLVATGASTCLGSAVERGTKVAEIVVDGQADARTMVEDLVCGRLLGSAMVLPDDDIETLLDGLGVKPDWQPAFIAAGLTAATAIVDAGSQAIDALPCDRLGPRTAERIVEAARRLVGEER